MTAFAEGKPNVENLNVTAENNKAAASGLNMTDLVVSATADDAVAPLGQHEQINCRQCKICKHACIAAIGSILIYPM